MKDKEEAVNIIKNWSYTPPTKEGDYLVCYGDVETEENTFVFRAKEWQGGLVDKDTGMKISDYSSHYKFARLVYRPSEVERLES